MKASTPTLERWPTALPVELIGPALARVEVAFCHGNRDEALAAVNRVFDEAGRNERISLDAPVGDLQLAVRVVNALESIGVLTVRQLCGTSAAELQTQRNMGHVTTDAIQVALQKYGWSLRVDRVDGGVPEWAMRLKARAG